ncbi:MULTISPECIES: hypothetical protein [Streptomyces]|uniref:hypothetical protein n=1 Tax=Streptomyces TaxID=1883 RepID=UPI000AE484F2|nr:MULTISPECIES: hypothetical protein [Streptomyces]
MHASTTVRPSSAAPRRDGSDQRVAVDAAVSTGAATRPETGGTVHLCGGVRA